MDVATLRRAMSPTSVSDATLAAYLPHYLEAMRAAEITTVRRAAAFDSQIGHESAGLRYMAEIATDGPGWTWDRKRYRGRGPIQLTWQSNYRKFGQWCKAKGYVTDPELFVNQPELVEQPKWGFLAASWYWLNAGPKPGQINGFADKGDIYSVSRCVNGWRTDENGNAVDPNGWPDRQARWNRCLAIGDALLTGGTPVPDEPRPDFNEYWVQSPSSQSRNGTKIDLWLLHTQEGGGGNDAADNLAQYLANPANKVSYHYTASQASDGGVTVCDVVDTDLASWSVLSANNRSINFCFAGSRASWSRADWMKQSKAIDVAAYLAVQDCKKYGIPLVVIGTGGNYSSARAGVADHQYVTKVLKDGTHTDVGGGFPVDYFTERFNFWAAGGVVTPPVVTPPAEKRFPDDWSDREIGIESLRQQRGPSLEGWPQLDDMTVVDYLAALGAKIDRLLGGAQ